MTREEEIKRAAMKEPTLALGTYQRSFRMGDEWADSHPHWISVEDELPNDGVDVLTVNKFNFQVVCFRFRGYWFSRYGNEYNDITHWMPLPEKLKKGGEE